MMQVLVTGSEGFLGQHLVRFLEEHGHHVLRYDIALGGDILDREMLSTALEGMDVCVHLAAVADLYHAEENPEKTHRINIDGTRVVLDCCDLLGVRLLYASTCCAYGNNGVSINNEESPVAPTEVYALTKLIGEEFVLASPAQHSILRLATFYGPQMRSSLATSIFLEAAKRGEPIHVHGSGEQTRCFTYVGDVVSAIRLIMDNREVSGIINVSDDRECSVLELAEIAMEVAGRTVPVVHIDDREGQIERSRIDNSKLRALGWEPKTTLEEGLLRSLGLTLEVDPV